MRKTQERIMAGELFIAAQPDPSLLPQEVFDRLVQEGKNTVEGIAQALQELAYAGNAQAQAELARLQQMADEFRINRHWLWEPDCGGTYTLIDYQPYLTRGLRNCIAWLLVGEKFVPVWPEKATAPPRPSPERRPEAPAQAAPSVSRPPQAAPGPTGVPPMAQAETRPSAPAGSVEVELRHLKLAGRPDSPLPDTLWPELLPGQDDPLNAYLVLARLAAKGDVLAARAIEQIQKLAGSLPQQVLLPAREQEGRWLLTGDELTAIALVVAGRKTAQVTAAEPAPSPAPVAPLPPEVAQTAPSQPQAELPAATSISSNKVARLPADLDARIEDFARRRSGLGGIAQAEELAELLEACLKYMPEPVIQEVLGHSRAKGSPERRKLRAARLYLCRRLNISRRYCNRLLRLLSLPASVRQEGRSLTEAQLRPLFKLDDEALQLAVVRAILHYQKERSTEQPWTFPSTAVSKLVQLLLGGKPLKEALPLALERKPGRRPADIVEEMRRLSELVRASLGKTTDISPERFLDAYKELELALGAKRRELMGQSRPPGEQAHSD